MNYYSKYLKYKKKYIDLKLNLEGGSPTFIKIKKNEFPLLYRSAPAICDYKTTIPTIKCSDTNKIGVYLTDNPLISIAMCLEYDILLEIGVFEVLEDLNLTEGKYSFRDINPSRYFDENENLILYVNPLPEENISHIEKIFPLKKNKLTNEIDDLLPYYMEENWNAHEVFLTNCEIRKIRLKKTYKFNPKKIKNTDDLLMYIQRNNYPTELQKYIDDKILVEFNC